MDRPDYKKGVPPHTPDEWRYELSHVGGRYSQEAVGYASGAQLNRMAVQRYAELLQSSEETAEFAIRMNLADIYTRMAGRTDNSASFFMALHLAALGDDIYLAPSAVDVYDVVLRGKRYTSWQFEQLVRSGGTVDTGETDPLAQEGRQRYWPWKRRPPPGEQKPLPPVDFRTTVAEKDRGETPEVSERMYAQRLDELKKLKEYEDVYRLWLGSHKRSDPDYLKNREIYDRIRFRVQDIEEEIMIRQKNMEAGPPSETAPRYLGGYRTPEFKHNASLRMTYHNALRQLEKEPQGTERRKVLEQRILDIMKEMQQPFTPPLTPEEEAARTQRREKRRGYFAERYSQMTPEEREERAEVYAQRFQNLTPEERKARNARQRANRAARLARMTPAELAAYRKAENERIEKSRRKKT